MLSLLIWAVYGLVVGSLSRLLYTGEDPKEGFLPTIAIGVCGSYVGGFINFLLGKAEVFSASGILMGVLGGVICCYLYQTLKTNKLIKLQAKELHHLREINYAYTWKGVTPPVKSDEKWDGLCPKCKVSCDAKNMYVCPQCKWDAYV